MLQKKYPNSKMEPHNTDLLTSFNKKLKNVNANANIKWSVSLDDELNELLTKIQSCNISKDKSSTNSNKFMILDEEIDKLTTKMQSCGIDSLENEYVTHRPSLVTHNNFLSRNINKKKLPKNNVEFDFLSQYPIDLTESKRIAEFKVDLTADLKLIIRKLLVFDLDGTLFYNKSRSNRPGSHLIGNIDVKYLEGSFRERNYYVYPRKRLFEFLHFLLYEYKNAAVWTSMEERNAQPIIKRMVGEENMPLFKFIWYREECQKNIKTGKWATEKPINKIINDNRINPDRSLKHTDVMIYDDNPKKIQLNDPTTIRIIPTFDATKSDNDDDFLLTLMNDIKNGNFDVDYMAKYRNH
jgi:hypothetical protein